MIQTSYGLLDPNPIPARPILSRNYGRGPGQMSVNLRIAKFFTFGTERKAAQSGGGIFAAPAERHYTLSVSLAIRNLLNHTNPGPIIGNITSPLFGQANQMAGGVNGEGFSENADNRRLEMQMRLAFSTSPAHVPRRAYRKNPFIAAREQDPLQQPSPLIVQEVFVPFVFHSNTYSSRAICT